MGANILAMHTLPALWGDDAHEFKPERWLTEQAEPEGKWMPFLIGPRACLGRQ